MPIKIYFISDLHLEFEDENIINNIYINKEYLNDYLILAGDICCFSMKQRMINFFDIISKKFKTIIYIAGNHEYYKNSLDNTQIKQILIPYKNVYFLQDEYIKFPEDDIIIYGTTLWTRLSEQKFKNYLVEQSLNDYKYIKHPVTCKTITREFTGELFEKSYKLLKDFLNNNKEKNIIIVSHHLPLTELICKEYKDYILNSAYASDLADELKQYNFDYWIFGHTHFTMKHELVNNFNKTIKFMCNPRGYNNENKNFNEDIYIEI
jgi:predicted phosphohydrolase